MIPSTKLHELELPDGGKIVADTSSGLGICVKRLDARSHELVSLQIDQPSAGLAGGGWVASPSCNLLVLHYYSGQSEESFVLLSLLNCGLTVVAQSAYQFGEYASYAFSADEGMLVMALPRRCDEWWSDWVDNGLEIRSHGVEVSPFATLLICLTDSGQIHRVELEIAPALEGPADEADYDPDLAPQILEGSQLSIRLPWGNARVELSGNLKCVRLPYPPG